MNLSILKVLVLVLLVPFQIISQEIELTAIKHSSTYSIDAHQLMNQNTATNDEVLIDRNEISYNIEFNDNPLVDEKASLDVEMESRNDGIGNSSSKDMSENIRNYSPLNCPDVEDYDALMALYEATNGDNWINNIGWGQDCDLSTWFGITTNNAGNVIRIDLRDNALTGFLPNNWELYQSLHTIYLQNNTISGNIPSSFGATPSLRRLFLQNNMFSGNIPIELGDISLLERLNLSNNDALGGEIPSTFENLTNLNRLYLQNNSLLGSIPSSLALLTDLERIYLHNNQFSGSIPAGLGNLQNLTRLYLQNNDLTGCIPEEFSNLCSADVRLQNNECLSHANGDFSLFCLDSSCETIPNCVCPKPVDYDALMELYLATNGDQWLNNSNWGQNCDLSTWHGITTNGIDEVIKIDLRENGLTGTFPDNWDSYPALNTLYLMNNDVGGNVPSSLGSSNSITIINLNNNGLFGALPPELGDISQLEQLILSNNDSLSGTIPESFSNLSKLRFLYLQNNNHSGELPLSLGAIDSLERLLLQNNAFTGSIPPSFGSIPKLERLYLQNNDFEGCIPLTFANLCALDIRLQNNDCLSHQQGDFALFCLGPSCEIIEGCPCPQPADYLGLVAIYDSLDGPNWINQEGWKVDCDICNWFGIACDGTGRVIKIDLRENNLAGSLPTDIGSFEYLRSLFLQGNTISDSIPASIGDLENLIRLHLASNNFSGDIPSSIANLNNLENLYLQDNLLEGSIPSNLDQLPNLNNLYLSTNQLTGSIPASLGSITTLKRLSLHHNNLSGGIPNELSSLQNLEYLYLNNNQIIDTIPIGLGSLNNLKYLYLSSNELEGPIPSSLGNLDSLQRLRLSHNNLSGEIPSELTNLDQLQQLFLNHNELMDSIPEGFAAAPLSKIYFQNNTLSGQIPTDFANLEFIEYLYLGNNQLEGAIPAGIEEGGLLRRIYLQNNDLSGNLPEGFGTLDSLTHLFVQNNDFTGCIPSSYANLCDININLMGNDCLSHNTGDMISFCAGEPCDASNTECDLCSDGIQNNGETQVDCGGLCDICRPDLAITALTIPDSSLVPGIEISSTIRITNIGQIDVTDTFFLKYFISEDSILDATDLFIEMVEYYGIGVAEEDSLVNDLMIPTDIAGGSYYLIAVADQEEDVELETIFDNNRYHESMIILDATCTDSVMNGSEEGDDCGGADCEVCPTCDDGIQNQEETGVDCGGPNCAGCPMDLVALTFNAPTQITKGIIASFNTTWGIERASVPGNYFLGVYLSQDSILDNSEDIRIYFRNTFAARGKGKVVSFLGTNTLLVADTIPAGDYFLIFNIEEGNLYEEYSEDNNSLSRSITVLERQTCFDGIQNQNEVGIDCGGVCNACIPDLTISNLAFANFDYVPGTEVIITSKIGNIGQEAVLDAFQIKYYLSSDSIFDISSDILFDSTLYAGIDAAVVDTIVKYAILPLDIDGGIYNLFVVVDPDNTISLDTIFDNNIDYNPINILAPTCTDGVMNGSEEEIDCGGSCNACPEFDVSLEQLTFEAGTSEFTVGETIDLSVSYLITDLPNQVDIISRVVISTDTIISEDDIEVGIFLDEYISDGFYVQNYPITIPSSLSEGTYNIIVRTNNLEIPSEDDYSNNIGTILITLNLPNPCDTGGEGEEGGSEEDCEECPEFLDLAMTYIFIEEEQQAPGGYLNVTTTIQNFGTITTTSGSTIEYYLSMDGNFDTEEDNLLASASIDSLSSCQSDETITNVLIPAGTTPGEYTVFVWNTLEDATSANDLVSESITIVPAGCMDGIQNQDETYIDCGGVCPSCIEICDNNIDDDGDGLIDCLDGDCDGEEACPSCTDGIMNGSETGVDCGGPECVPCVILDIVGISLTPRAGNFSQYPGLFDDFNVNYQILNIDAGSNIRFTRYLSTDTILDENSDINLGGLNQLSSTSVGTHQSSSGFTLPVNIAAGDYYLIVELDSEEEFTEADENNNIIYVEYTVLTATCDDGIQNQGESGIDCGGPFCPECPIIDIEGKSLTPRAGNFSQYPGLFDDFNVNYQILNVDAGSNIRFVRYLSTDTILDENSDINFGGLNQLASTNIGTHQSSSGFTLPVNIAAGDYYLIVELDSEEEFTEADENNNIIYVEYTVLTATCDDGIQNQGESGIDCGGPFCPECPIIDIEGVSLTPRAGNFSQYPGLFDDFNVNYQILNVDAGSNIRFVRYLSTDTILDENSDINFGGLSQLASTNIGTHQSSSGFTLPLNTAPGDYYLIVKLDSEEEFTEADETNNEIFVEYTVLESPDLQVTIDNIPNIASPGETMPYGIILTNNSSIQITDTFMMTVFLSEDASLSASTDSVIQSLEVNGISADTSFQIFESLTIPQYAVEGDNYLIFWGDSEEEVAEFGLEANNIINSLITINPASCADGILNQDETDVDCGGVCLPCETCFDGIKNQNEDDVDCGGVCPPCIPFELTLNSFSINGSPDFFRGQTVSGNANFTISNRDLDNNTPVAIYLSTDDQLDPEVDDRIWNATYAFETQGTRNLTLSRIDLPIDIPIGNYYLIFKVDWNDTYYELNEDDNDIAIAIEFIQETCDDGVMNQQEEGIDCGGPNCSACPNIDFIANSFSIAQGSDLYRGQTVNGTANYTLANQASVTTPMAIYLSVDDQWDVGDGAPIHLATYAFNTIGTRNLTISNVSIPTGVAVGDYYLIFRLDPGEIYDEEFETNNTQAFAITLVQETCDDNIQNQDEEGVDCGGPNCPSCPQIDFIANSFSISGGGTYFRGQTIAGSANYTLANQSSTNTPVAIYISEDAFLDEQVDDRIWNATYAFSNTGTRNLTISGVDLPQNVDLGNYYLIFKLDWNDAYDEGGNEDNNTALFPIVITDYPDLIVSQPIFDNDIWTQGQVINFETTLETNNEVDVTTNYNLELFVSEDAIFDPGVDVSVYSTVVGPLASLSSEFISESFVLNESFTDGTYYVIAFVDSDDEVDEGAVYELNNTSNAQITINTPTCSDGVQNQDETGEDCGGSCLECKPDFIIVNPQISLTAVMTQQDFVVSYSMNNIGYGDFVFPSPNNPLEIVNYQNGIYLSEDNVPFSGDDIDLNLTIYSSLAAGESNFYTHTLSIPDGVADGQYNLIFVTDKNFYVTESDDFNNYEYLTINVNGNSTCCNNIQDPGENGIDCGDVCGKPCPTSPTWSSEYMDRFDEDDMNRPIDVELEVGRTRGAHSVSPTGGAKYSIPIVLPPGTQKMVPSLSLNYNSQSGNGNLGFGWGLGGSSTISRINKTLYHDGELNDIMLDSSDVYALDGSRLIVTNGESYNSNAAEYRTEVESFSLITPMNNSGDGPEWFLVQTKEGMISEYGKTEDSKLMSNDESTPIFWRINKMSDQYGNYVEFRYVQNGRELLLDEVLYTGNENASLAPYNSIKFHYMERGDKNVLYVHGNSVESNNVLNKIEIFASGNHFKTYKLRYTHEEFDPFNLFGSSPINSFLQEVQEYGADLDSLNSTRFKYGENLSPAEFIASTVTNINNIGYLQDVQVVGDYNGDGISDFALLEKEENDNGFYVFNQMRMYISNGDGTFAPALSTSINSNSLYINKKHTNAPFGASDIDGDGKDEIIIIENVETGEFKDFAIYNLTTTGTISKDFKGFYNITASGIGQGILLDASLGDFDGDRELDILGLIKGSDDVIRWAMISSSTPQAANEVVINGLILPSYENLEDARLIAGDFNGDGKTQIMSSGEKNSPIGSRIYGFDVNGSTVSLTGIERSKAESFLIYPTKLHYVNTGDFNGDGKTDILTALNSCAWEVGLFDGISFQKQTFNMVGLVKPQFAFDQDQECLLLLDGTALNIADFNSDGKSDIMYIPQALNINIPGQLPVFDLIPLNYSIHYSLGTNFTSRSYSNELTAQVGGYKISSGDFNGDGKLDISAIGSGSLELLLINKESKEQLLTDILDGFNNRTTFNYNYLTDSSVYTRTNPISEDNYYTLQNPMTVVDRVEVPNGLKTEKNAVNYQYKNALFHKFGRGFLGFEEIEAMDECIDPVTLTQDIRDLRSVSLFVLDDTYFAMKPSKLESYLVSNGELIGESFSGYSLIDRNNSRFWMRQNSQVIVDHINNRKIQKIYIYDDDGNISQEQIFKSASTGFDIMETSVVVNSEFDGQGAWTDSQGYNIKNKPGLTEITKTRSGQAPYSKKTRRNYNSKGSIIEQIDFDTEPKAITTSYNQIDNFGNSQELIASAMNQESRKTTFVYDVTGRFIIETRNPLNFRSINPLIQVSSATYDPKWGRELTKTNVEGLVSVMTYDQWGREHTTATQQLSNAGKAVTTSYHWDVGSGDGTSSTSVEDAVYYLKVDGDGLAQSRNYVDAFERGRMTTEEDFLDGPGNTITQVITSYDIKGKIRTKSNPHRDGVGVVVSTTSYDQYDRIDQINHPTGITDYSYSPNANGELITSVIAPTAFLSGTTETQTSSTDATGKVFSAQDEGGGITEYIYYSHDGIKEVKINGTIVSETTFDQYARQTSLIDKNAGITTYEYNAFGELEFQEDAKGNTTSTLYDVLGRVTEIISERSIDGNPNTVPLPESTTTFSYVSNGSGVNKLESVIYNNVIDNGGYINTQNYTYDIYRRIDSKTQNINGQSFTCTYDNYDEYDRLLQKTYPSGLIVLNTYDDIGFLTKISTNDGSITKQVFQAKSSNAYGQMTEFDLGNNRTSINGYDIYGIPDFFKTSDETTFYLDFTIDVTNGNLYNRTDSTISNGLRESFLFDTAWDRLISTQVDGLNANTISYSNNGNIKTKSDVSMDEYLYDANKIHALSMIPKPIPIAANNQDIEYNSAQQPISIVEGSASLIYQYGSDQNRRFAELTDFAGGYQRYYLEDFERDIRNGSTRDIHYLGMGIIVVQENGGSFDHYYAYSDYLGSILTVTDDIGEVIAKQNFDAWGRKRNAENWTFDDVNSYELPWLYRGFTGHEMLAEFNLINMNGRLYDPVVGRMLSPDNYAGQDGTTQSYNRYSYALNNPLKFTDPDGENPLAAFFIGAFISGLTDHAFNDGRGGFKAMLLGGLQGLATFGIGEAFSVGGIFGNISNGVGRELLRAGLHGANSGLFSNLNGGNFGTGFANGAFGSLFSHALGDLNGNVGGAIIGGSVGGAFGSLITGQNVLNGASTGLAISLLNYSMHVQLQGDPVPKKGGDEMGPAVMVVKMKTPTGEEVVHYITEAFELVGSGATAGSLMLSDGSSYLAFNSVTGRFQYVSKGAYFIERFGGKTAKANILAQSKFLGRMGAAFGAVGFVGVAISHKQHGNWTYTFLQSVSTGISSFAPKQYAVPWTIGTWLGAAITSNSHYRQNFRPKVQDFFGFERN